MERVRVVGEVVRRQRRAVVWGVFVVTAVGTWFFGLPFALVGGAVAWRLTKVLGPDAWCGSCATGACERPDEAGADTHPVSDGHRVADTSEVVDRVGSQ